MKRAIAFGVVLTFLAGCSGANGGRFVPGMSPNNGGLTSAQQRVDNGRRHHVHVGITMRIPRHRRGVRLHPATISPSTQSVGISVNGGAASVFNATPSSPNCHIGSSGLTCTFGVTAPVGSDTFSVATYSAISGGGTILDRGSAVVNIVAGQNNTANVTLGPVVSIASDTGIGSLRYAIANANPGDTIMFLSSLSGQTIALASSLKPSVSVTIAGPGFTTSTRRHLNRAGLRSDLTFNGLTISGGGSQQLFVINSGITATISGLILTDGKAATLNQPGGAVYNAGQLTLASDAITANNSIVKSPFITRAHKRERGLRPHACAPTYHYAGGVYNHGLLTVSGTTFDSNVLTNNFFPAPVGSVNCQYSKGGAIYNDQFGTLISNGNTYSNNAAYEGGAVFNNSTQGQASFTNDTFTGNLGCNAAATGCATAGCTGSGNCTSYAYGDGAAIYDNGGPGVTIAGSTFTNNVAGGNSSESFGQGGAIDLETGTPQISTSTFTGNAAGGGSDNCSNGEGGAIYENASGTLELDSDTFSNNSAGGDSSGEGGAIYNNSNPDSGSNDTFSGNSATGAGSACTSSGYADGGAIAAYYGATLSNSTFTSNSVTSNNDSFGGAVYENATTILTGDTFTSNTSIATGTHGAGSANAGAAAVYGDGNLRLSNDTFTSNSVTLTGSGGNSAYGGAVYADGTVMTSIGDTFASNSISASNDKVYGGAVQTDTGTLVSTNDTFKNNSATVTAGVYAGYGGAIYIEGGSASSSISGATFTANTVSVPATAGADGGAYYNTASGSTQIVNNSVFTANAAGGSGLGLGGAIYDASAGATFNGVTISGNSATEGGGGFFAATGDTINNSTISANTVTMTPTGEGGGGALFGSGSGVTVQNSTISGNTVALGSGIFNAGGGGLYNYEGATLVGDTISGNSITGTGHAAGNNGGGGIYNSNNLTIANSTISSNSSSVDGGGFDEPSNYTVSLTNVTLNQNTATGNGGNIYNANNTTPFVTLYNTIVTGGTAGGIGPDIDNSGTLDSGDFNLVATALAGGGTFTPGAHDKVATGTAGLQALANNGGPTFTNADQLSPASTGQAYVPFASSKCGNDTTGYTNVDQRGYTRGAGSKCDIGAFEFNGVASAIRPHARPTHGIDRHHYTRPAPAPPHHHHVH